MTGPVADAAGPPGSLPASSSAPSPAPSLWPPREVGLRTARVRPTPSTERRAMLAAIVLSLAFAVPVTWSLQQPPPGWMGSQLDFSPVDTTPLLAIVAAAALLSAVIGGGLATLIARRHALLSGLVALVGGWMIAASLVPVFAAWLGVPLMAGSYCIDGCLWAIRPGHPADGFEQALVVPLFALVTFLPAALAGGLLFAALILARAGRPIAAVACAGLAWSAVNIWLILSSVAIPFLLQVQGVVIWATVLLGSGADRGTAEVRPG